MKKKKKRCVIIPFGCLVSGGVFRWKKKFLERCREPKRQNCAREVLEPWTLYPMEEEMLVITDVSQIDKECEKYIVEEFCLPLEK